MTDAYAQAIRETAASVPTVRLGTVLSNLSSPEQTVVKLDSDQSQTPITAISACGILPTGTRVAMMAYPPRGLLIVGRLDGEAAYKQLFLNNGGDASPTSTNHEFQIGATNAGNLIMDNNEIEARNNGVISSLFLNNDGTTAAGGNVFIGNSGGAGLVVPNLRATQALDTTGFSGLASTSFIQIGTIGFTFNYPPSGVVVIHYSCNHAGNTTAGQRVLLSPKVTDTNAGGTARFNPSEIAAIDIASATASLNSGGGRSVLVSPVPTSGVGFVQMYARVSGGTGFANNMVVIVQPST